MPGCFAEHFTFFRLHWPAPAFWFLKLYTSALAHWLVLIGVFSTIVGLTTGSGIISAIGIYDVLIFCFHIFKVTRPPSASSSFELAFGLQWEDSINAEQKNRFLPRRTLLNLPAVPDPQWNKTFHLQPFPGQKPPAFCSPAWWKKSSNSHAYCVSNRSSF
jgi:hypothetical protein